MAKIEDLIREISDQQLRNEIAREVAALKKHKTFGLVFEEHIPEQVQILSLPVKPGLRVVKRGKSNKDEDWQRDAHRSPGKRRRASSTNFCRYSGFVNRNLTQWASLCQSSSLVPPQGM